MLFDEEYQKVKVVNPNLSEEEIRRIVFVSVYPPNLDAEKPPPHSTGGALDLTVMNASGDELNMGCAYCEFGDRMYTNSDLISETQRENRIVLLSAMVKTRFANFPGEWWHFMYGEREYAAYMTKILCISLNAIYGRAKIEQGDKYG